MRRSLHLKFSYYKLTKYTDLYHLADTYIDLFFTLLGYQNIKKISFLYI